MKNHTPSKKPKPVSSQKSASLARSHRRSGQPPRVQTRKRAGRRRNPRSVRMHVRYGVEGVPTRWSRTEPLPTNYTELLKTHKDELFKSPDNTIHKLQCGDKSFKQTASSGASTSKFMGLHQSSGGNWGSRIKVVQIVVNVQIGVSD